MIAVQRMLFKANNGDQERESPASQRSIFALTMTSQTFIFHKYVILSVPKMELIIDKLISFMVNTKKVYKDLIIITLYILVND